MAKSPDKRGAPASRDDPMADPFSSGWCSTSWKRRTSRISLRPNGSLRARLLINPP